MLPGVVPQIQQHLMDFLGGNGVAVDVDGFTLQNSGLHQYDIDTGCSQSVAPSLIDLYIRYSSNKHMGNTAESPLTISISAPSGRMFDFHRDAITLSDRQELAYPSFLNYAHKTVEYCPSRVGTSQEYEIRYAQGAQHPELSIKPTKSGALPLWRSLKADEEVQLEQGDTIKLGETELVVEKICTKFSDISCWSVDPTENIQDQVMSVATSRIKSASRRKNSSPIRLHSRHTSKNKESAKLRCNSKSTLRDPHQQTCRICLDCDNQPDNPLLSVCQCSGSVRLIHYGCLKTWLSMRTRTVSSESYDYSQYDLTCDLCKSPIQKTAISRGQSFTLHGEEGLTHPPLVVMRLKSDGNRVKQYTVNFHNKDSVVLGKSPKCDLSVNARFLDKQHCQLSMNKGSLYIQNYSPTYGTFVSLKTHKISSSLNLMLGNHLITINRGQQQCCQSVPLELKVCSKEE